MPSSYHHSFQIFGSGPTILFIHGFAGNRLVWRHIIPRLSNHYQCVTIDLPGCGHATIPSTFSFSRTSYCSYIRSFLSRHSITPIVIVGHSFGATIAIDVALTQQIIPSLFLINPLLSRQRVPLFIKLLSRLPKRLKRVPAFIFFFLTWLLLLYYSGIRRSITLSTVKRYSLNNNNPHCLMSLRKTAHSLLLNNISYIFPKIPIAPPHSIRIVHGKNDKIVPLEQILSFYRKTPFVLLNILDKVGHLPTEESPELIANLLASHIATHNVPDTS